MMLALLRMNFCIDPGNSKDFAKDKGCCFVTMLLLLRL